MQKRNCTYVFNYGKTHQKIAHETKFVFTTSQLPFAVSNLLL